MDEIVELPVTYKGEEVLFPFRWFRSGYATRFSVDVYGTEVLFEPDEEQQYRAVINPEGAEPSKAIDTALLQEIARCLEFLVH